MKGQIILTILTIWMCWLFVGLIFLIIYEFFVPEIKKQYNHCMSNYPLLGFLSFSKKIRYKYICNKCF